MADANEYILLMHDDAGEYGSADWEPYLQSLVERGVFQGGSEIGGGVCVRKDGVPGGLSRHLSGYIRLAAASVEDIKTYLEGNPHFEAGGTVEIRELPRT